MGWSSRWMATPFPAKASKLTALTLSVGCICFEVWLGRKRLLQPDLHYICSFVGFILVFIALSLLLRSTVFEVQRLKTRERFAKLQLRIGVLSGATVTIFCTFGDYSQGRLDDLSIVSAMCMGFVLGSYNAWSTTVPATISSPSTEK